MTRHRFSIVRFFIFLIALAIGNDVTVSPNPVNANTAHSTASFASVIHFGAQPAYAKKGDEEKAYCWKCTCPYHADSDRMFGKKHMGTWRDQGWVQTDDDDRGEAESAAHEKCEREATDKNCHFWSCSCTGPKRRTSCN